MTTANTALQITELDFFSIRNNLKDYLRSQDEFTDYDFEGSGMSVLLDILAYNTHYMAMNLNLVANEMFLDSAQIRADVLSHAKLMNYVPRSKTGAEARVNIRVTPGPSEDNTATTLTLPRYTRFLSNPVDGISYNFVTVNANTATKSNGSFLFSNVCIKSGEALSSRFVVDAANETRRFVLDSDSIDTSTIRVTIQESEANNELVTYTLADDITTLDANSKVFWVEENSLKSGNYTLYFGDGVIGAALDNGNIVRASYLVTPESPENANRTSRFTCIAGFSGFSSNIITTTVSSATSGSQKETIENIRFRAPVHYAAQNRAVNKTDYEILLLKDYPNIESVSVWSGSDNVPPVHGKVFISLKPVRNYALSTIEKERIKDQILSERAVLTVFPEIVDPEYTYLLIRARVNYNSSLTTLDEAELASLVRAAILDYSDSELKQFNSTFRKSRLQRRIDTCDPSITSCELDVFLQKRFTPELNVNQSLEISYNVPLFKAGSIAKLFSYPEVVMLDSDRVERRVFIEEVPDSFSGIDRIVITNTGDAYTSTPTVTITGDGTGATATAVLVNRKLKSIEITNRGINYSRAICTITGGGGSGGAASVELQAKNGTLRTFYYKSPTGEKIVINSSAGTIDYDSGLITLSSFEVSSILSNPYYDSDVLTLSIQPENDTVKSTRESILDIDENDASAILIEMIKEDE